MDDTSWLRHTFALAESAIGLGDQPYGAALVGPDDTLLVEAVNDRARTGDCTGHAERLAVAEASRRWSRDFLRSCTLFSSTEPCPMCSGAVAWSGVGRLVFGLSQATSYELFQQHSAPRFRDPVSCRVLLENVQPAIEVVGPLLEDEAAVPHKRWLATQSPEGALGRTS
jgi:tRNA(Arg) A34 adenosine deaminase TadA